MKINDVKNKKVFNESKIEPIKLDFKKIVYVIIISFLVWFFFALVSGIKDILTSGNRFYYNIIENMCEEGWYFFIKWISNWLRFPLGNFSFLPIIALIIVMFIGLRRGEKSIFRYPLIFTFIVGIIVSIYTFSTAGGYIPPVFSLVESYMIKLVMISLIVSTIFYYKKEKLVLIILGIIFVLIAILGVVTGEIVSHGCSSQNSDFEDLVAEKLPAMKEKAIAENNINGCVGMIDLYEGQRDEIISEFLQAPRENDAPRYDILYDNYLECVEKVAIKSNNESLCAKVNLVQGLNDSLDIDAMYKDGTRSNIYLFNCIDHFVLATYEGCDDFYIEWRKKDCIGNESIEKGDFMTCAKIGEGYCIKEIAVKNNDLEMCKYIFDGGVEGDCVHDIMLVLKDSRLCETMEGYSKRNCNEAIEEIQG